MMVGTLNSPLPSPLSSSSSSSLTSSTNSLPTSTKKRVKKKVSTSTSGTKDGKKRRTYQIKHVHVALDIKMEESTLEGYVILTMQSTSQTRRLSQIKIHARQLAISKIYVENVEAQFNYKNYLDSPVDPSSNIREVLYFFTSIILYSFILSMKRMIRNSFTNLSYFFTINNKLKQKIHKNNKL